MSHESSPLVKWADSQATLNRFGSKEYSQFCLPHYELIRFTGAQSRVRMCLGGSVRLCHRGGMLRT